VVFSSLPAVRGPLRSSTTMFMWLWPVKASRACTSTMSLTRSVRASRMLLA